MKLREEKFKMHDIMIFMTSLLADGAYETLSSALSIHANQRQLLAIMQTFELTLPVVKFGLLDEVRIL